MDATYKWQRHIYDVSRKYYLFGRDRLISDLDISAGQSVLEMACGTGRNLDLVGRKYRKAELYGFDISNEMLISAQKKLGRRAQLTLGDACDFDAKDLFERSQSQEVKDGLVANTSAAVERGAFGIPTMYVGPKGGDTEMFFGKERLAQIEEELAKG